MSTRSTPQPSTAPTSAPTSTNTTNRVSISAEVASSSPLPPQVRSAINHALLASNAVPTIQAALLHECQASGFVAAVRARVLELLRTGQCASYGELMATVMAELKAGGSGFGSNNKAAVNGTKKETTNANALVNGDAVAAGTLRVPKRVMEEGVRVVRGALEGCVDITTAEEGAG